MKKEKGRTCVVTTHRPSVPLKSGESRRVEIKLNKEQLRYWDVEKGQFVVPKGAFDVMVGASSKDIRLQTVIDL